MSRKPFTGACVISRRGFSATIATGAEMSEDIRDVRSRIQVVPICGPQRNLLGAIEHPLLSAR
jgi:hypothetical protein